MKLNKILLRIANLIYRMKIMDFITYVKVAYNNYIAFLLSLINMAAILKGIVLPKLKVKGLLADVIVLLAFILLFVIGMLLGWIDTNAGISRKTAEKQAYWRKPPWSSASIAMGRIYPLPEVVILWKLLEEKGMLDEKAKECLRRTAYNTVSWVANSYKGIAKSAPLPRPECIGFYLELAGVKDIDPNEIAKLFKERPEYR